MQGDLNFNQQPDGFDGYSAWHAQRAHAQQLLAHKLGVPLNRMVCVRLNDGMELTGVLRLKEELLFVDTLKPGEVELCIGRVAFKQSEIESCVVK
ncbi:MAG: hypothetical protein WCO56_28545 [Verrucomicrobiota bacterium]